MDTTDTATSTLPMPPATVHMVGIGGIGVSGLARILLDRGYTVTGSDLSESPVIDDLRVLGIDVQIGHRPENLGDAALVVTTAAARDSNPELAEARARGVPVIKRAKLLGELASLKTCLAVAGTHGKSTTAGMMAYTLAQAGQEPSFAVGATVPQLGANAGPGDGPHFVVEADEYDHSFLTLEPDVAVITNIEHDHPDLFPDLDSIDRAFQQFASRVKGNGTIVLSGDDAGCRRLGQWLRDQPARPRVVTVGRDRAADWFLDDSELPASLRGADGTSYQLDLVVPGPHNRLNAAMVFAVSQLLGIDAAAMLAGLSAFTGVGRRFDFRGERSGIRVFDDYAHHPTELAVTLSAARERFPSSRIWAVFQPHTFSRTRQLLRPFAEALDDADRAVLVDIYPARETDDLGVSSQSIADLMQRPAPVFSSPGDAAQHVAQVASSGDIVLCLGAGDIWKASEVLLKHLSEAEQPGTTERENEPNRTTQPRTGAYG